MATETLAVSKAAAPYQEPYAGKQRIVSLDIFRGLNIALMIFVNELAEVHGLPWWNYHAPRNVDVMTYVDMVFPGFLLIMGMSLPLAINSRLRRGDGLLRLVGYITLRAAALIVLGIILANGARGNPALMHGIGRFVWGLLAIFSACLVWMDYPHTEDRSRKRLHLVLRIIGMCLLVALAIIYRRTGRDGTVGWFSYSYPEILGLIGYTYFTVALCYLLTRRWRWAAILWFVLFTGLNCLESANLVHTNWPWWKWPIRNGSMCSLAFAGMMLCNIFFLEPRLKSFREKARVAIAFGFVTLIAARLLHPLGISKIRATPTWVLYTVSACCFLYTLLYWICDVKRRTKWAFFVRSAGSNTLLTYLLPDIWFYLLGLLGVTWFETHFSHGWLGVPRALIFTALMLAISTVLTNMRLRLQL